MLKTFLSATAISALMVSGALAQAPQPPAQAPTQAPAEQPATPPAATPSTPAPSAQAPATQAPSGPQFIASQSTDQMLASQFRGTDVLGSNNEKIGDVNDVLFDKEGKVVAIVVGVGGFLGIGQKDVAIDLSAFEIVPPETRGSEGGTASAPPAGNTGSSGSSGMSGTVTDPNNVNLRVAWTREQLDEAPAFERYRAPAATTGTTGSGPVGGGPTPR